MHSPPQYILRLLPILKILENFLHLSYSALSSSHRSSIISRQFLPCLKYHIPSSCLFIKLYPALLHQTLSSFIQLTYTFHQFINLHQTLSNFIKLSCIKLYRAHLQVVTITTSLPLCRWCKEFRVSLPIP